MLFSSRVVKSSSIQVDCADDRLTLLTMFTMFTVVLTLSYEMDDTSVAAALSLCALAYYNYLHIKNTIKTKKRINKRRWWMTSIHRDRSRLTMDKQISELISEPSGGNIIFNLMSVVDFEYLLNKISPAISKRSTHLREPITSRTRLAITLRFLTSGDSFKKLDFIFKVSPQIISNIIPEVCEALNLVLKDEIKVPSSPEEWLQVERGFKKTFPHAIGLIDGKNIVTRSLQPDTENCKDNKNLNIVLLSIIDSNYTFIAADIANRGNDGEIFKNCLLWPQITSNALNFPAPRALGESILPYVLLGDDAFALSTYIMKPYSGSEYNKHTNRIFDQKLVGARVVVENTFGILASKFRIFRRPLSQSYDKVSVISMTCFLLHNFLRKSDTSSQIYTPPGTFDMYDENEKLLQAGSWRNRLENVCAIRNLPHTPRGSTIAGRKNRDEFSNYFINENQTD